MLCLIQVQIKEVFLDFDDTSLIDINKTTAVIEGLIDNGKIIHQVKIPQGNNQ